MVVVETSIPYPSVTSLELGNSDTIQVQDKIQRRVTMTNVGKAIKLLWDVKQLCMCNHASLFYRLLNNVCLHMIFWG